jgi:Uma2 family endonuclease
MASVTEKRATLDDLYRTPGKAELISGRIVEYMATGYKPNRAAGRIFRSLDEYTEATGRGYAHTDNLGYAVAELPSGRESFSPDASYHDGPLPQNPMRFVMHAPRFAAEVRSETDYTPSSEAEMAEKRADYFTAGTEVVWDVDTVKECVHVYRKGVSEPTTYTRGQMAEAEPAIPGWKVAVDWIFS